VPARLLRPALCAVLAGIIGGALVACGSSRGGGERLIVYEASKDSVTNIYTIDPADGTTNQLTHGTGFDGNPAWSRDYTRIIFASNRDGQAQNDLYTMNADGSGVRRLTDTPGGEYSAKYSPDGTSIAYVLQDGSGWIVRVMDADGRNQRQVAGPYEFAEFPSWTHDGSQLYYSAIEQGGGSGPGYGRAHIYSANVKTGEVRTRIETAGPDVCPHFSRDGSRLTYAAPNGSNDLEIFAHDMASTDTSGAHDTALTTDPARDDYGNASPDDRTMVFVSDRDGNPELYLMERDGSHERRLTNTPGLSENVPDW
jgi:TolB protein